MKKALKTVLDVLVVAFFLTAVVVLISSLSQQKSGIPGAFGYSIASVQTNSMSGTMEAGDMVVGKITDGDTQFNVGDIVTFRKKVEGRSITITHRISDVKIVDGIRYYETWGDNRSLDFEGEEDVCYTADQELKSAGDIISRHCLTIRGLGRIVDFLKTPVGFVLCLVLPLTIYIIYEASVLISAIMAHKKEQFLREYLESQAAAGAEKQAANGAA